MISGKVERLDQRFLLVRGKAASIGFGFPQSTIAHKVAVLHGGRGGIVVDALTSPGPTRAEQVALGWKAFRALGDVAYAAAIAFTGIKPPYMESGSLRTDRPSAKPFCHNKLQHRLRGAHT